MGEYKRYTDEQIEQAKNADIIDFLNIHGYELKQTSRDAVKIPHYGGLIITPSKMRGHGFQGHLPLIRNRVQNV